MWLSVIAIKYTLIDIVVFDYMPFPSFTHTTGMTLPRFKLSTVASCWTVIKLDVLKGSLIGEFCSTEMNPL